MSDTFLNGVTLWESISSTSNDIFYVFLKIVCTSVLASLIRKLRFKPIGNRGIQVSKKASKHKSINGNIYWKSQILHDFTSQKKEDICCKNWLGANLGELTTTQVPSTTEHDFSRTATWFHLWHCRRSRGKRPVRFAPQSSCCCSNIRPVRATQSHSVGRHSGGKTTSRRFFQKYTSVKTVGSVSRFEPTGIFRVLQKYKQLFAQTCILWTILTSD